MSFRRYACRAIRPEMTVRQVAADFPGSEDVFRGHGEQEAPPARFGHLEPLTHFARRHGVALDSLLSEIARATEVPVDLRGRFAGRVHHGFILSAVMLTLTLGAGWGAWLLWQIGTQGAFEGASAAHVVAHGEAQLWGFTALFVMGISLRTVLQGVAHLRRGAWISHGMLALALVGLSAACCGLSFPKRTEALDWLVGWRCCYYPSGYAVCKSHLSLESGVPLGPERYFGPVFG